MIVSPQPRVRGKPLLDYVANVCMGNTAADIKDFPSARDAVTGNYPAPDDCAFRLRSPFKNEFLQLTQNT